MPKYITDLKVSLNDTEETNLRGHEYKKIMLNLNEGAGGNKIYLWYKEGTESPITRIQFSFCDEMEGGLSSQGYVKIEKNLNAGAGGSKIYLWFYKGDMESDVPITDIYVSDKDDAKKFKLGWERLPCNLNRGAGGAHIFLWVKREKKTYISEIIATDSFDDHDEYFKAGYTRVDESTNRGTDGAPVFLWYLQTTKKEGTLKELKVSTNDKEYENMEHQQGYEVVNMNLNKGNAGNNVFLWYTKENSSGSPIQAITMIYNKLYVSEFEKAGVNVIEKSLNSGDGCGCWHPTEIYLGFYN